MKKTTTTTAAVIDLDTLTGEDFPRIAAEDYDTAAALIENCLTHAAKMMDSKGTDAPTTAEESHEQTRNGGKGFAMDTRRKEAEELTQAAWLYALDRAENPRYNSDPLKLYLSKAAGTALRRATYHAAKIRLSEAEARKYYGVNEDGEAAAPDAVIDGRAVQKTFPAPGEDLIKEDTRRRILDEVSERIRAKAAAILADLENGFSVSAAAERNGIPPKTALDIMAKVKAAAAIVTMEDGEYARFERLIMSDEKTAAAHEKRAPAARAAAITAAQRERAKARAAARATMNAAPGRLNAAAYMAMTAAYRPAPRMVKWHGKMWTDADRRAAAAAIPAEAVRKSYRRTK